MIRICQTWQPRARSKAISTIISFASDADGSQTRLINASESWSSGRVGCCRNQIAFVLSHYHDYRRAVIERFPSGGARLGCEAGASSSYPVRRLSSGKAIWSHSLSSILYQKQLLTVASNLPETNHPFERKFDLNGWSRAHGEHGSRQAAFRRSAAIIPKRCGTLPFGRIARFLAVAAPPLHSGRWPADIAARRRNRPAGRTGSAARPFRSRRQCAATGLASASRAISARV